MTLPPKPGTRSRTTITLVNSEKKRSEVNR